jgi:hypothetical protein
MNVSPAKVYARCFFQGQRTTRSRPPTSPVGHLKEEKMKTTIFAASILISGLVTVGVAQETQAPWDLNGDWDCTLNCNPAGGPRHIIQHGSSINFYGLPSSPSRLGIANWSGTDRMWVPQWQTFANIRRCNDECRYGANVVVFDNGAVWQRR